MQTILLGTKDKHSFCLHFAVYCPFSLYGKSLYRAECSCLARHVTFLSEAAYADYFLNYGLITKNWLKQKKDI